MRMTPRMTTHLHQFNSFNCSYYEPPDFQRYINTDVLRDQISLFHLNCHGLSANWDSFHEPICNLSCPTFSFDVIGISGIYQCKNVIRLRLTEYHDIISQHREDGPRDGVGLFIKDNLIYKIRDDISVFIPHTFESVFIEKTNTHGTNVVICVIY